MSKSSPYGDNHGKLARLKHINILVMDADVHISKLIKRVLISLGFKNIYQVYNGQDGLSVLRLRKIDLIITDWDMEPMNGIEFINYIRRSADSPNRTIPIIMLTGKAKLWHVQEARDTGMTEFLVKPFTVASLCERISLVIEHPRNFIISEGFAGPDRRRKNEANIEEERRDVIDDKEKKVIRKGNMSIIEVKKKKKVAIIDPDYSLKEKIGKNVSMKDIFTPENIKKAQQIINDSKDEFLQWVAKDLSKLEECYDIVAENPDHAADDIENLANAVIKIKAQAGTFGYSLATDVADAAYTLIVNNEHLNSKKIQAFRIHIDILYVIFQQNLTGDLGKIGGELKEMLDALAIKIEK